MKNLSLRTDGFYSSGPVEWEDWHAGVHMRETHYHFWRFYPDGNWVHCYRCEPAFQFWDLTETLTPQAIESAQRDGTPSSGDGIPLFTAGTYVTEGDSFTTRFEWRISLSTGGSQSFHSETQWMIRNGALKRRDSKDDAELRFSSIPSDGANYRMRTERGD